MPQVSMQPRAVTGQNTYIPAALAFSIIFGLAWMMYYYFSDRSDIELRIQTQGQEINARLEKAAATVEKLSTAVQVLSDTMLASTHDRFVRQDAKILCLQMMLLNKGFICPDYVTGFNGNVEWTTEITKQ